VYEGAKAVDSIDLDISGGEVFGFLGPNGAGKTTTIGMMVGLIEPTSGKCYIKGIDVTRKPMEAKRVIGYLPDGVGFYGNLTARQNLEYFAKLYELKNATARISELLEYVGLAKVEKPSGGFSRGMKQRLGLAAALLNDPEVIFLDEPTNGLDPQGVIQFRHIIADQAKAGKTIVFSSHILEEVQHVCTTVGIIAAGKLIARGSLEDVKRQMRGNEDTTIILRTMEHVPHLDDPRILDAVYNDGSAIIRAKGDIRDDISVALQNKSVHIRELRLKEESLEDAFLKTVYGGE
jgi:ABC-2 type transport system ATP-binding protein